MNATLLADLIASEIDGKTIDINGNQYEVESYSENEKLVVFVNGDDEEDNFEYFANLEDAME